MVTYTKLRDGSWGVRGPVSEVTSGTVRVAKKDGTVRTEMVTRVVWTGNGVALATIAAHSHRTSVYRSSGETKTCWECGREFTYRQCVDNDGEWADSYCGC